MSATAAALLDLARGDGCAVRVDDGRLRVRGPSGAVAQWLPLLRPHKPALLSLLSEPRRIWRVRHADGTIVSHSFTPPASLADIQRWYPGCDAEPEPEPEAPPGPPPADADLAAVRGWLARAGEQDRGEIAAVLDRCRDPAALAAFLRLAAEPVHRPQETES